MPSLAASRRSSVTVIAPAPLPVPFEAPRLRAAALAPSRPSAVRVFFESFVIVFFWRAPAWPLLTFLRAACRCFRVAISPPFAVDWCLPGQREAGRWVQCTQRQLPRSSQTRELADCVRRHLAPRGLVRPATTRCRGRAG